MNNNTVFDQPIAILSDFGLSFRNLGQLEKKLKAKTIRDLVDVTPQQILALPNCSDKTLENIQFALREFIEEQQQLINQQDLS